MNDEIVDLLRRAVEALERNADYTEYVRGCYERRERQDGEDRIRREALRVAEEEESRANTERMIRAQEEAARHQKAIVEQQAEILATYREHIADCDRWHKRAAGVKELAETVQ